MKKAQTSPEYIIEPTISERESNFDSDSYYYVKYYCSNCENPSCLGFNGVDVMIKRGLEKIVKLDIFTNIIEFPTIVDYCPKIGSGLLTITNFK